MNVWFIIFFCIGMLNGGGIGVVVWNLMNVFVCCGYVVFVVFGEVFVFSC